ncbi:MAG: exodeoxyribonuclease VII large subunit [Saprospiraceae bacterium]|nr:exodeoxyribonuclease VII large subunit [Saprospiraceae bacterium]
MELLSLYDLNTYIKQAIALNFSEPIWISAELSSVKIVRGHVYLELIQKNHYGEEVIAQSRASLWSSDFQKIKKNSPLSPDEILQVGYEVKIQVLVEYHERFGLSLVIKDIDASFTLGKLELEKQEIINKLAKDKLLDKNQKNTFIPLVPQKLAVITSKNAAGWKDFESHLLENPYGYSFSIHVFEASMQGTLAPIEISKQIQSISSHFSDYDLIIIIRGGGSKMDLNDFNDYELAKAIANSKLPIITGIGHEIDQTIADLVAHTSLKTPTAVANFLVDSIVLFESNLIQTGRDIERISIDIIRNTSNRLEAIQDRLNSSAMGQIANFKYKLDEIFYKMIFGAKQHLQTQKHQLEMNFQNIHLNNPLVILKKGYTLTFQNDKKILSAGSINIHQSITTVFHDGEITSSILKSKNHE